MFYKIVFPLLTVLSIFIGQNVITGSLQGEEVYQWANAIGRDLWNLGRAITRYSEIEKKYTFLNAKVQKKDPVALMSEINANMSIMINRKIRAIKKIQEMAEKTAESFEPKENFTYYSSRYSPIRNESFKAQFPIFLKNKYLYKSMTLDNDTHFYNVPVNTDYSSVHVPMYVYDRDPNVSYTIQWSEKLDVVFRNNYFIDPALSWQYFGSMMGIMRHYPAQKWEDNKSKEILTFDCRIRTWFIEAATCTKDIVILIDNSGSMRGMPHHIGSLTAFTILDTLSNNDYVNILNYTLTTNYTIPCFENMLVQATEENIRVFKSAVEKLQPEGKTQVTQALEAAFQLLALYREKRNCVDENSNCNQAIMIITDGINEDITDIVTKYNHLNNGSNIPVRIFGYLVGMEVTNPQEMKDTCCENRGYYTPVRSLEQVTVSVLQYVSVIARPMVLQAEDHPVSWTHAYADVTYDDKKDNTVEEPYRLLTSVAIPCYDTRINKMNDTTTAYLLGVAATDVPIDEFERITVPYKIGVNGYAFIVSNNGYLLMHPDLRPMYAGILKFNYNSVDLTQVEHHVDDNEHPPPRKITDSVLQLRQYLVDGKNGSISNITLRYHYDNMRRVFQAKYDYYFSPIEKTPFTLGIALPHGYGMYSLDVGDQIMRNKHTGENLTSFFTGKWKVNRKWVYCKYHYLEGHEFSSPEEELLHFLNKMYGDFVWKSQYEDEESKLERDSYYCDMHLVQRLIFDARITHESFGEKLTLQPRELPLFQKYNASLRFVATQSGLTRWDDIFDEVEDKNFKPANKSFGDLHPLAINEKWYKNAVIQRQYDDSFVYSVPFDVDPKDANVLITASFAIFPSENGHETPGSVVGFQFSQRKLKVKFNEVSSKLSNQCWHCSRCNDTLDCYIVDSSGYIIVAENDEFTGSYFGERESDIMGSMIRVGIFKEAAMYDYQALCKKPDKPASAAANNITPLGYIQSIFNWFVWEVLYAIMVINFSDLQKVLVYADDLTTNDTDEIQDYENPQFDNTADRYFACETELNLVILQQEIFLSNFHGEISNEGGRNYYVKRIPKSNLIFVAINTSIPKSEGESYSTKPRRITEEANFAYDFINTTLLPCQKLNLNNLSRRRLTGCYNNHPLEKEIVDCGRGVIMKVSTIFLLSSIFLRIL
ncbi:voltage-dependent calcium channel subunit alpha-2/delta-3 [Diorhabda carinulata]|uniref:voltage-dependent calcium channel subunit alpha-2/delta-3 n=1 Tax=Diorhabda carinulata TaxID=1163345 RepID=UPI0025A0A331|nr:voltage-dependent calcium channel subunit alpha-2/delta-3 [Diorhabda carinulata]XP_057657506.1 voltage-dependent calcium channel subunit alpha-2/delta-3 [Diorhabda carinulata]XP_057657515.1 voltage-dependent calcium channel subunit alpha-2/delta-3 [Diorhabda carinulata]XP_057657524.1 voltage-dependent calcium channel subunit alpha-2/delta-3 [Diorhabda carinulata]